jgi:MFS family permease
MLTGAGFRYRAGPQPLARDDAHGKYQGIWGIGNGLGQQVAPVFLTSALAVGHAWAWAWIAAIFAGAGLITNPVIRWADRSESVQ